MTGSDTRGGNWRETGSGRCYACGVSDPLLAATLDEAIPVPDLREVRPRYQHRNPPVEWR